MLAIRDAIFVTALITAAAYARWHYWWRTGFGRARMILLLSVAALTTEPALRHWTGAGAGATANHILNGIALAANTGVLISLLYLLCLLAWKNIQRVRRPADRAEEGRRYLKRTPWATDEEIGKMIACWDEAHSRQGPG
jgi:hypothetical protein